MCTILTVSTELWKAHRTAIIARIKADAVSNSDGITAVILGDKSSDDLFLSAMNISSILDSLCGAMDKLNNGRLFLHQRMATTQYVGLAYNHGFTDLRGTIIMHNGILRGVKTHGRHVDSFALTTEPVGAEDAVLSLMEQRETYANVFRIMPNKHTYEVLRLSTNTLFGDTTGNYSTNRIEGVELLPVKEYTGMTHVLEERKRLANLPKKNTWNGWLSTNRNAYARGAWADDDYIDAYDSSYEVSHESSSARETKEDRSFPWVLKEYETLKGKNKHVFVLFDERDSTLCAYSMETGEFLEQEEVYGEDYNWQARYFLDEVTRYESSIKNMKRRGSK